MLDRRGTLLDGHGDARRRLLDRALRDRRAWTSASARSRKRAAACTARTLSAARTSRFATATSSPSADGHRVNDVVRRAVRFQRGNVLADDFLSGVEPYDAIFCRNLLIYFDEPTQDRTIATLCRMLTDNGLLFVGPAESSTLLDHDLVSAKVPLAFAFRRMPPRAAPQPSQAPAAARSAAAPKIDKACGASQEPSRQADEAGARRRRRSRQPRTASTRPSRSRTRAASRKPRRSARSSCARTARRRRHSI